MFLDIITSFLRLLFNLLIRLEVNFNNIKWQKSFIYMGGIHTLSCMYMYTIFKHRICLPIQYIEKCKYVQKKIYIYLIKFSQIKTKNPTT